MKKEQQKVADLMKPRYKVIADWPGSPLVVGQILIPEGDKLDKDGFAKHPHLFQPLQWWEDRKPEEMPEYLKDVRDGQMYKWGNQSKITPSDLLTDKGWVSLYNCAPATEAEYLAYKQPNP